MKQPETFIARILEDNWLPFPDRLMVTMGWREGDRIEVEIVGDCLVLTRKMEV